MGGRNGARSVLSRMKDLGRCFSFGGNKMANGEEEEEKTMPVYTKAAKSNVDAERAGVGLGLRVCLRV
jgi:hypothetical protein